MIEAECSIILLIIMLFIFYIILGAIFEFGRNKKSWEEKK